MKRAVSIVVVSLAAALIAGVLFLLPPTVSREVVERSVIHGAEPVGQSVAASYRIGVRPSRGLPVEPVIMRTGKHR